jgi:hypothetical protein
LIKTRRRVGDTAVMVAIELVAKSETAKPPSSKSSSEKGAKAPAKGAAPAEAASPATAS